MWRAVSLWRPILGLAIVSLPESVLGIVRALAADSGTRSTEPDSDRLLVRLKASPAALLPAGP